MDALSEARTAPTALIETLAPGSLDIVGDVHGEIDALEDLLTVLGYEGDGRHPDGRRLVFVGDLVDRGPSSPAVLRRVLRLVRTGCAQCLLGNHEINLLRDVERHGNGWWVTPDTPPPQTEPVEADEKSVFRAFLETLPLVLERADLRIVHACWQNDAIDELRQHSGRSVLDVYHDFIDDMRENWRSSGLADAYRDEWREYGARLRDRQHPPPMLHAMARMDADHQMANPVALLTSGAEQPASEPLWAGGKWRMVERVKWWEGYTDPTPVICGHYWRRYSAVSKEMMDNYGPDLFAGIEPHQWMGAGNNVYCVDFSVGGRYLEREQGGAPFQCKLAALRVPEWQLIQDDGETWEIGPPGLSA
jgi:hypothetical protein